MRILSCIFLQIALSAVACSGQSHTQRLPSPPPLYRIVQNNLYGFIDSTGAVRVKPRFLSAQHFSEGLAAVRQNGYYGYIDVHGQYVLPPQYDYATPFDSGEAIVWVKGECYKTDRLGTKKAFVPAKKKQIPYDASHWQYSKSLEEEAQSLGYEAITAVYQNRRFARRGRTEWFLTDAKGKPIQNTPYNEILYLEDNPFDWNMIWEDGMAIVKIGQQIGAIDLDGNYTIPLRSFDFNVRYFTRWGHILVLGVENPDDGKYQYGIWNMANNTLIEPKFEELDGSAFLHGGLIPVVENHRLKYITPAGKYVWTEKEPKSTLPKGLNIDYMLRGFFYAASPKNEAFSGLGGWGGSNNYAHKTKMPDGFEANKIQLVAFPSQKKAFSKRCDGFRLTLANTSNDTLVLNAQDSRINIYLQALDPNDNTWRDILYQPSSWCGNSYHKVFLAPGEYWDFVAPVMEGELRTKLRFRLAYVQKDATETISNSFEGGINPAQFWRKEGYAASSLMDPYDE